MSENDVALLINKIETISKPVQWGWKLLVTIIVVTSIVTLGYAQLTTRMSTVENAIRDQSVINDKLRGTLERLDITLNRMEERVDGIRER